MIAAVFDTESSLVSNSGIALEKQPRVIEFYGCLVNTDGVVLRELGFLCNPERPIEKEVTKITGITDAMVADKKPFREYIPELQSLFMEADAAVGHNISHDIAVVNFDLQREGILPSLFWPERFICTVEATEHLRGFRLSLSALHEHLFNQGFTGHHRAKNDTMATVKCYVELLKRGVI